jgi:hypothetical protein
LEGRLFGQVGKLEEQDSDSGLLVCQLGVWTGYFEVLSEEVLLLLDGV